MRFLAITIFQILFLGVSYCQITGGIQYIDLLKKENAPFFREGIELTQAAYDGIRSGELTAYEYDFKKQVVIDTLSISLWENTINWDRMSLPDFEDDCWCDGPCEECGEQDIPYFFEPKYLSLVAISYSCRDDFIHKEYIHFYFPPYHPDNLFGVPMYTFSISWEGFLAYLKKISSEYLYYKNQYHFWWKGDVFLSHDKVFSTNNFLKELKENLAIEELNNVVLQDEDEKYYDLIIKRNNDYQIEKLVFDLDEYIRISDFSNREMLTIDWKRFSDNLVKNNQNTLNVIPYYKALENNLYHVDSLIGTCFEESTHQDKDILTYETEFTSIEKGFIDFTVPENKVLNNSNFSMVSFVSKKIINEELDAFNFEDPNTPIDNKKYLVRLEALLDTSALNYLSYYEFLDNNYENLDTAGFKFSEYSDFVEEDIKAFNVIRIVNTVQFNQAGKVLSINPTFLSLVLPANHPKNFRVYDIPICSILWEDFFNLLIKSKEVPKDVKKVIINHKYTYYTYLTGLPKLKN